MSELVVKELTPSLRDDFLLFLDHVAFADNLDWSDCYCSDYDLTNKGKAESRREASSVIEEDRMHGFLPRQWKTGRLAKHGYWSALLL